MIQFINLKATDCFSYRSLEFDFVSGLHSIQGANGSSKTSIFLTLQQCLFNRNSKGCKVEEVNNLVTGKPYEIELIFNKDHMIYKVVNSRKQGCIKVYAGPLGIEEFTDVHNISLKRIPDNLKLIEEILGTDYQTFSDLIYQSKNTNLNLLDSSTNKGRAEFVNNILKLSEIDGHLDRMNTLRKELEGKSGKIATLEKIIDTLTASKGTKVEVEGEIPEGEVFLELSEGLLEQVVEKRTPIAIEVSSLAKELASAINARQQLEQYAVRQAELDAIVAPDKPEEECKEQLSKINTALIQRTEQIKQFKKELLVLETAHLKGKCPTCGHGMSDGALEAPMADLDTRMKEALAFVDKCVAGKQKYEERLVVWGKINTLTRLLETMGAAIPIVVDEDVLEERLQAKKVELAELEVRIASIKLTVAADKLKVNTAKEHNAKVRASIQLNKLIDTNNETLLLKIDLHNKELSECVANLELVKTWVGILGPKGYRTARIAKFLQSLNKAMHKYAGLICNGRISCSFFINEAGEIDFSITDASKAMDIALWSGGETSRIKLVCLFAVLELLEVMGTTSFNVLCLDEIFDTLDPEGKEGLFRVLDYLKGKGKAIYTIAHSDLALDLVYDSVVRAVKLEDGTTEVTQ